MSAPILWVWLAGIVPVWCVGAFGVAATQTERYEAAIERERLQWHNESYIQEYARESVAFRTAGLLVLTFFAGASWPVAIPVWFAYRKGDFVNRAVAKRADLERAA